MMAGCPSLLIEDDLRIGVDVVADPVDHPSLSCTLRWQRCAAVRMVASLKDPNRQIVNSEINSDAESIFV